MPKRQRRPKKTLAEWEREAQEGSPDDPPPGKVLKKNLPSIKQDLTPCHGVVIYRMPTANIAALRRLDNYRAEQAGHPVHQYAPANPASNAWRNDPATDKQREYLLKSRGICLPASATKGDASRIIDDIIHSGVTPKQRACLEYHGYDWRNMRREECYEALDLIHIKPRSFHVPEPWETAKYRLHPNLYIQTQDTRSSKITVKLKSPPSRDKRSRSYLWVILVCVGVLLLRKWLSWAAAGFK